MGAHVSLSLGDNQLLGNYQGVFRNLLTNNVIDTIFGGEQFYDLNVFENYYLATLQTKFLQKSEKIANPTRLFSDDNNVFVGLTPWTSVPDFGTFLHTMIGYGVRFRNPDDVLYFNETLAYNLVRGIQQLYYHLPFPAPINQAPWGQQADWYHFSITMTECVQHTCIVLRGFYNLDALALTILSAYLPAPTFSLGWQRTAGNVMRMCLPYCYGQLLRGYTFDEIAVEQEVAYVLNLISFPLVESGNGIHRDYAYFDHTDVRAYGYLINSFFTFSYYNFMFGDSTVNIPNLTYSIALIGSEQGIANPAVMARNGTHYSNVLGYFINYPNGVFSADFSKILTVRNNNYFGSVVGQAPNIAYYEADTNNDRHAPLWAMTKKIWPNDAAVIRYRPAMLGLESGILLTNNLTGDVPVPTTSTSTSSFVPSIAQTAVCATANAGAMAMRARFDDLFVEFHSYTLYHRYGMFQFYDQIKTLKSVSFNPRCIVLTRDTLADTNEARWVSAGNTKSYNHVTTKHHNIVNNPNLANFTLRTQNDMQLIEQIIAADSVNRGAGVACFSLLVQDTASRDTTNAARVDTNIYLINTNQNSIQCVIAFPILVLKDDETREVTINDATSTTTNVHTLEYYKIERALSYLSLSVSNLQSNEIRRTETAFVYHNDQANQFRFSY